MIVPTTHTIAGRSVEDLILTEIDGELSSQDTSLLARHTLECTTCRAARTRHRSADNLLRRSMPSASETARARVESLRRITDATAAAPAIPSAFGWSGLILRMGGAFGFVVMAAAIALVVVTVRNGAAAPSGPDRVELVRREAMFPGVEVVFWVEEGRAMARPNAKTGVVASAEMRFSSPQERGLAEIRVREPGGFNGFLARAPDLTGVRRVLIQNGFPPADYGSTITYEVWVHLETAGGIFDTEPILIEIQGVAGGEHAILH